MWCFFKFFMNTGQSSSVDVDAISFSLSLSSFSQSNMRRSAVWSPLAQTHSGDYYLKSVQVCFCLPMCSDHRCEVGC